MKKNVKTKIETLSNWHCQSEIIKNHFFVISKLDFDFWYMTESDFGRNVFSVFRFSVM